MKILVDAMGGDNAPDAVIKGVANAIEDIEAEVILIGQEAVLNTRSKEILGKKLDKVSSRIKIVNAKEVISMEDTPTQAIKTKKDSSMVVGFNMLKNGDGDVFISAGNSGALLTGATLIVGRIKGIDRPALAGILPAYHGNLVLMDCGANTNCKPINLVQFAQMASIYMSNTVGIKEPKIGLLNIGTEETKGNELVKESYQLLKKYSQDLKINFIGNVEGREAFLGDVDVLIADGFKKSLKESIYKNAFSVIGAIPSLPALSRFAKSMDYKEYGGALFLGVKKPVVKAHGSSDAKLFEYTIKQAEKFVENKAVEKLTDVYQSKYNAEKMDEIKKFIGELEKR